MKQSRVFFCALFGVFGFGFWWIPCQADTDYQCLHSCVNESKPAAVCLSNCSYNLKIAMPSLAVDQSLLQNVANPSTKMPTNHDLLAPPVPIGDKIILAKPKSYADAAPKDYICMTTCLQKVRLYDACDQQCTPSNLKLKPIPQYSAYLNQKTSPIIQKSGLQSAPSTLP